MDERAVTGVDGVELTVVEEGEGPVVLLAHGFPELARSWRHQLPALAAAGYRAVAVDQRGYGASGCPSEITDYDIEHLVGDLVAVLDDLGEERATIVGHDWGSMVASHVALLHPGRTRALVNMSVPHVYRGPVPPLTAMRAAFGDDFFYIIYFQEPGPADAELGGDPARTMRRLLAGASMRTEGEIDPSASAGDAQRRPDGASAREPGGDGAQPPATAGGRGFVDRMPEPNRLPDWLPQEELDAYVEAFERTGFTGGLNWYRNFDRNWHLTEHLDGATVDCPTLFVGGALDPVLVMSPPAGAHPALTDHRGDVVVPGAGHWVQQEAPGPVNAALVPFLDSVHER